MSTMRTGRRLRRPAPYTGRVLSRIDLRGSPVAELTREKLAPVLPRAELDVEAAIERVRPICDDVRHRGAAAVREYTLRFDGVDLASTRVPAAVLSGALDTLAPDLRAALEETIRRLRLVSRAQRPGDVVTSIGPGATVTERYVAVGRAGVYVPGGLVTYPSSVLMNVVPAQVAGVPQIAVASPPQETGLPSPAVLAAKRLLLGTISTDAEAGPTEIAIIADDTADPEFVAADLIAQAEHDPLAACLLITTDEGLADRVDKALEPQIAAARHRERVQAALAGQSACVLVDDADAALATSDAWAPEHLEIQAQDAGALARRVRNAGAIFVGPYAPVSLGDYLAGSNHVLPTGGTARHTAGLSVLTFLRAIHLVEYERDALAEVAPHIDALGGAEDLAAHVAAVRVRIPRAER